MKTSSLVPPLLAVARQFPRAPRREVVDVARNILAEFRPARPGLVLEQFARKFAAARRALKD